MGTNSGTAQCRQTRPPVPIGLGCASSVANHQTVSCGCLLFCWNLPINAGWEMQALPCCLRNLRAAAHRHLFACLRSCRSIEVALRPRPDFFGNQPPQLAARQVGAREMNAAVATRHPRFIRSFFERFPFQRNRLRRRATLPIPVGVSMSVEWSFGSYPSCFISGMYTGSVSTGSTSSSARNAA